MVVWKEGIAYNLLGDVLRIKPGKALAGEKLFQIEDAAGTEVFSVDYEGDTYIKGTVTEILTETLYGDLILGDATTQGGKIQAYKDAAGTLGLDYQPTAMAINVPLGVNEQFTVAKEPRSEIRFHRAGKAIFGRLICDDWDNVLLTANAWFDGTSWHRDVTTTSAVMFLEWRGRGFCFNFVEAGANPITWRELLKLDVYEDRAKLDLPLQLLKERITFGTAEDVNLYRGGSNILKTDDQLVLAWAGGWDQLALDPGVPDSRIAKYRVAGADNWFWIDAYADAGYRATVGCFRGPVGGTPRFILLKGDDTAVPGIEFLPRDGKITIDGDTSLFRAGVDRLKTGSVFEVGNTTHNFQISAGTQEIWFGNRVDTWDTRLYRSAANTLRASGDLIIDGKVGIGTTSPTEELEVAGDIRIGKNNQIIANRITHRITANWPILGVGLSAYMDGFRFRPVSATAGIYPEQAVDGCYNSVWRVEAVDLPASLTIDLGGKFECDPNGGIIIAFGGWWYTTDFVAQYVKLEGSDDGTTWYTQAEWTSNSDRVLFIPEPGSYRYYRLTVDQPLVAGNPIQIAIFEGNTFRSDNFGRFRELRIGADDVNLYRGGASLLKTDDAFLAMSWIRSSRPSGADASLEAHISGEAAPRLRIRADGVILFGDGTSLDVSIYRFTTDCLKTNDNFNVGTANYNVYIDKDTPAIYFGNRIDSWDVKLYRAGANRLKTDDDFDMRALRILGSTVIASDGSMWLQADKSLYARYHTVLDASIICARLATDTYDRFGIKVDGTLLWGPGNAARDVNLYRAAADVLATDDMFKIVIPTSGTAFQAWVSGDAQDRIRMDTNFVGGGGISFGGGTAGSLDVNLYRAYANVLQTDDDFRAPSLASRKLTRPFIYLEDALKARPIYADATTQIRDSPHLQLYANYFDGTKGVDRGAFLFHEMLSTAPTSRIKFQIAGTDYFGFGDDGDIDLMAQSVIPTAGALAGYATIKIGGVQYKIALYAVS